MKQIQTGKALIDVRRLAAVDLYGRRGAKLRRRLVLVEFVLAAIDAPLLGVAILLATSSAPWILFGTYIIAIGLNYVPLALHAISLSRPGKLDAELAGADVGAELRRYAAKQFFLVIPLLVLILGAVQAAVSRRAPRNPRPARSKTMYQPPRLNRSGTHVISCTRLTKSFGPAVAVRDLDLDVSAGQVYGFLGPNGAGKTTTIRMLLGLIAPTGGQIRLLGRPLPDPRAVAQTGSMIEEPAFYPWLTGRQNLQVLADTGGGCAAAEVGRVLDTTGLSQVAGRKVRTYSQGMRQRLGLAAAMLGRPPLLIIDEPTNGLDPAGIREIRGLLRDLAADGTTVFMSSHLLAEVEQVCDRVAVIVRGRLVEEGPPAVLGAARRRIRVQVTAADAAAAGQLLARWPARLVGGQFLVEHDSGRDVNAALAAGGVIAESVTVETPALEDRFLEIVEEEEDGHVVAAES